jgi:hypothetical protein
MAILKEDWKDWNQVSNATVPLEGSGSAVKRDRMPYLGAAGMSDGMNAFREVASRS